MGRFQAIFFDFDGTIADTDPDIRAAWLAAIADLGLTCECFDRTFRVGPSLPETARMLFPDADDRVREKVQTRYKNFYDDADSYSARAYPGVLETINALHEQKVKIFVVTNKRLKPTVKLLAKYRLLECCAGVFTPDIISPDKPLTKPEMVNLAMRVSGIADPRNILMTGDTEIDVNAGKTNGTATCAVTWGYASREKLLLAQPDHLIDTPDELLKL